MTDLSKFDPNTVGLKSNNIFGLPFKEDEAAKLAEKVRKRNVFARHSYENNFYLQRIAELGNRTIIEINRPGNPNDMYDEAERVAALIEKLSIISTTLVLITILILLRYKKIQEPLIIVCAAIAGFIFKTWIFS